MRFKHLKLFGACSVATLLFCFDAEGMNWQEVLERIGHERGDQNLIKIAKTPVSQFRNGVVASDQNKAKGVNAEKNKKEEKKYNASNIGPKENPKRSTVKKMRRTFKVSEGEFSQWIGNFEKDLIDPEELHFFSNSADYLCQLIDQGGTVKRNGATYGNQCSILALNLDEGTMLRIYDEMDRFDDYGHNFANHISRSGGLSDGDQKTWSRISDIIKYRVAIYTRHLDLLVCTVYGENKELPIKRVYLEPGHYQELLINKNPNSETSEKRNREEQRRETETPKQEKKKTVEDVRKEFIDAINSKKKQGEKKIDTLKKIFENSGLTENEELKKEMNLFESIFGESLHKFNSIWMNEVSSLMGEVSKTLKKEFYNKDDSLKDGVELQGKEGLVSDLSRKVDELEYALSRMKDVFGPWGDKVKESSVNEDVKKVLRGKLAERKNSFKMSEGKVSEYRAMLRLISQRISESSINLIINEAELYYNTIGHGDNYVRRNLRK